MGAAQLRIGNKTILLIHSRDYFALEEMYQVCRKRKEKVSWATWDTCEGEFMLRIEK